MRTILAEGVLQENLAVPEHQQIDHIGFDTRAIRGRACESRLHDAELTVAPALGIAPLRVRYGLPGSLKCLAHGGMSLVAGTVYLRTSYRLEYAVLMHERHQGLNIVTVPCLTKGLDGLDQIFVGHSCYLLLFMQRL